MRSDDAMERTFEVLDPTAAQRARMESALEPVFFSPPVSLGREWAELLRLRPLLHGTLALGATGLLWGTSPAAALLLALARAVR